MYTRYAIVLARQMRHDAVRPQRKVGLIGYWAEQGYPGVRLQPEGIAVPVDIARLRGFWVGIAVHIPWDLASARRMVPGDHRERRAVRLDVRLKAMPQLYHAVPSVLADRIRRQRRLIAIAAGE